MARVDAQRAAEAVRLYWGGLRPARRYAWRRAYAGRARRRSWRERLVGWLCPCRDPISDL